MLDHESNLIGVSESFTKKRNNRRVACLREFLPPTIDDEKLLDFLGGETLRTLRAYTKEFPIIIGGSEIEGISSSIPDMIRPFVVEKLGDKSYLKPEGDPEDDQSEVLTDETNKEGEILKAAYWQKDKGLLLGDHVGRIRMNALAYKFIKEPLGPMTAIIRRQIDERIGNWLANMREQLTILPKFIAGDNPRSESVKARQLLNESLIRQHQTEINELVDSGVNRKIAEARVLANAKKLVITSEQAIEYAQEDLAYYTELYPRLEEEYRRLKPVLNDVISILVNKTQLEHIAQIARFSEAKNPKS